MSPEHDLWWLNCFDSEITRAIFLFLGRHEKWSSNILDFFTHVNNCLFPLFETTFKNIHKQKSFFENLIGFSAYLQN